MQPATCHLSIHKVVADDYLSVSAMFGKRQSRADNGRGFDIKLLVGAWLKSWRSEQLTKRSCWNEDTCCRRILLRLTVEKKRWVAVKTEGEVRMEIFSDCKWPQFQNLGCHGYFTTVKGYADSNMHVHENTPVKTLFELEFNSFIHSFIWYKMFTCTYVSSLDKIQIQCFLILLWI